MTTHTPAPWKISNRIGRKSETGVIADGAPCIIAIMGNQEAWPVEAEANARLIAAAPELLEALEEMLDAFDVGQRAGPNSAIAKARRAYFKAKGE